MHEILGTLDSAEPLKGFSNDQLEQLGDEIRDVLCNLLSTRTAHFASNLGVVELCIALHSVFDFRSDRLIWDTGHQIYPHKLVTGRYGEFSTIRTKGGLMGYPNPSESPYDLFMTGHAGCSVSTALGLASGDLLMNARATGDQGSAEPKKQKSVAVIGDGAFPSGIVFEAMNNAGELNADLLMVLNDNEMSICPRVGGVARYLDRLRSNPFYTGLKQEVVRVLNHVPVLGDPTERLLAQMKEGLKAGMMGGMMFEELGFRYIGPIDGHNIPLLRKYLKMVKDLSGPVLLHVVTQKGHGYEPAAQDPVYFHTPPKFTDENGKAVTQKAESKPAYTVFARDAIGNAMKNNDRVTVLTAAMCQGNKLEPVRDEFADRFFDVGICESHAVAFAAGQCKSGMRPIVDIYSTFLQRSYDQIFQEVCLQDLPVVFMMDRGGLAGPDGPTHHGIYDVGYMRIFPKLAVMAPGYAEEVQPMLDFALDCDSPTAIRYPKCSALQMERPAAPMVLGKSEFIQRGTDVAIVAYGAMLDQAMQAAKQLESDLSVTVVNARFSKPVDCDMIREVFDTCDAVVTVEENALQAGFGSAILEAASDMQLDTRKLKRLGLPDSFIEHGERAELLADCGLDPTSIASTCQSLLRQRHAAEA